MIGGRNRCNVVSSEVRLSGQQVSKYADDGPPHQPPPQVDVPSPTVLTKRLRTQSTQI